LPCWDEDYSVHWSFSAGSQSVPGDPRLTPHTWLPTQGSRRARAKLQTMLRHNVVRRLAIAGQHVEGFLIDAKGNIGRVAAIVLSEQYLAGQCAEIEDLNLRGTAIRDVQVLTVSRLRKAQRRPAARDVADQGGFAGDGQCGVDNGEVV